MDAYNSFVKTLSEGRIDRTFLNSDAEHALKVLVNIFSISNNIVRIYAGSLCHSVGDEPEYISSLSDFIERGGTVKILLNDFQKSKAVDSNLFKRLAYYISEGKPVYVKETESIAIRANDPEKKPVHFTVGDENSYRLETDTENRSAECNMNNPTLSKAYADFFDNIFESNKSKTIDLASILNMI